MYYVYVLQSDADADRYYVGCTGDLKDRVRRHNAGEVTHTAKHGPWHLVTYVAFSDREKAFAFERYLKSGSGRAFTKRHF